MRHLQAIDGTTDWHVEVTVIDAEKNVEVARVTLPEKSVTLTAESWADAVAGRRGARHPATAQSPAK